MSATMLSDQLVVAPSIGQTIDAVNGYLGLQTMTQGAPQRTCERAPQMW